MTEEGERFLPVGENDSMNGARNSNGTGEFQIEHDKDPYQRLHSVNAGRTLDEFLEAAFQTSKGYTGDNNDTYTRGITIGSCFRQWRYWCILLSLGVANSSDATEILAISYMLGDADFRENMLDDQGHHKSGLLAGAVFFGMLVGGLVVGTMGDWIGRKPMLLLGLICNSVAGILSAFAPNIYSLVLLRCIAGLGIGATVPPLFTLATELAPPSARGFCVTICASFWMVGSIYVALVALWCFEDQARDAELWMRLKNITKVWRLFAFLCAIPSCLGAILVAWFVPESPRFLRLEGRSSEAVDIANDLVLRMNGRDTTVVLPLTVSELEASFPSSAVMDRESRLLPRGIANFEPGSDRLTECFGFLRLIGSDFMRSTSKLYEPDLRRVTLPLQLVWFSLSFGSYGLLTWINILFEKVHLQNIYFNALLFAVSNLPGNILTAIVMDRVRRSTSLVGSIALASVSLGAFAWSASHSTPYPEGIIASACLFQCFTVAAWNTIDTMTSELFPTIVRSTGLGICAASGRIGALVAQFVNDSLVESPIRLLLVASATLLLGALTPCLLPEDMTGQPVNDDPQQQQFSIEYSSTIDQHQKRSSGRWILASEDDIWRGDLERAGGKMTLPSSPNSGQSNGIVRRTTSTKRRWYSWNEEGSC